MAREIAKSWKTSVCGFCLLAVALSSAYHGDYDAAVKSAVAGFGLIAAKDTL